MSLSKKKEKRKERDPCNVQSERHNTVSSKEDTTNLIPCYKMHNAYFRVIGPQAGGYLQILFARTECTSFPHRFFHHLYTYSRCSTCTQKGITLHLCPLSTLWHTAAAPSMAVMVTQTAAFTHPSENKLSGSENTNIFVGLCELAGHLFF